MKVSRDAFIYLEPKHDKYDFAQCGPCRMWTGEDGRCIIHGSKIKIAYYDSCGYMAEWATPDGKPNKKVVEDHTVELHKGIPGSVTPEESGLVSRRVQCHRCRFANAMVDRCMLYEKLNKEFPDIFDLDPKIKRHACCNAQTPKSAK
jgi:hypothetical protein